MPEKAHWPFSDGVEAHGAQGDHERELANAKSLQARQAMYRQRARYDRLIVGGRAHAKKSGLS